MQYFDFYFGRNHYRPFFKGFFWEYTRGPRYLELEVGIGGWTLMILLPARERRDLVQEAV